MKYQVAIVECILLEEDLEYTKYTKYLRHTVVSLSDDRLDASAFSALSTLQPLRLFHLYSVLLFLFLLLDDRRCTLASAPCSLRSVCSLYRFSTKLAIWPSSLNPSLCTHYHPRADGPPRSSLHQLPITARASDWRQTSGPLNLPLLFSFVTLRKVPSALHTADHFFPTLPVPRCCALFFRPRPSSPALHLELFFYPLLSLPNPRWFFCYEYAPKSGCATPALFCRLSPSSPHRKPPLQSATSSSGVHPGTAHKSNPHFSASPRRSAWSMQDVWQQC